MDRPDNYESINTLEILQEELTELPSWISECKKLKELYCNHNKITHLDNLPPGLKILYCHFHFNEITTLDNLPPGLKVLN